MTSDLTVQALFIDLAKAETTLYALLDGTELTIRYDKLFEAFDKAASLEDIESETKEAVTKVVFDESVKDYEVTSLSNLCANMYQLTAVEGLKNINVTSLEDVSFLFQNCTSLTEINLNGFDIKLKYGAFPDRPYDSPGVWGNADKIRTIMQSSSAQASRDLARHVRRLQQNRWWRGDQVGEGAYRCLLCASGQRCG